MAIERKDSMKVINGLRFINIFANRFMLVFVFMIIINMVFSSAFKFGDSSMSEAMKSITPFDHGGYVMGDGFNPSDTMANQSHMDSMNSANDMNHMNHF